jgi:hypothetical protein
MPSRGLIETAARREARVGFVDDPIVTSRFDVQASRHERDEASPAPIRETIPPFG